MSKPVTGAPAYISNSSSPSLARSHHTNASPPSTSSSVTNLSLYTSSRSSISTGPSLIGHALSTSSISSLPPRHVSHDGSIVIESQPSSNSAPVSVDPLNTLGRSEKWMSKSAHWKALKDDHLFSISLFLFPEDTANASAVCSTWKQSLDKEAVWKNQCTTQENTPDAFAIQDAFNRYQSDQVDQGFDSRILSIIIEYDEYDEERMRSDKAYKAVFARSIPNAITPKVYEIHFRGVKIINPKLKPRGMRFENNQPDPDQPGKTIGETHIWTYRPGNKLHINGKVTMITMNILELLVQNPLQGHRTKFNYVTAGISQEQRNASMEEEGWDLMTRTVCEGTKNIPFDRQVEIVRAKGYEIPSGPDVILTALVWHVLTGEYPFNREPLTYTRTTSLTADGTWHWVVGGFGPRGLRVNDYDEFDNDLGGLAGLRKFS